MQDGMCPLGGVNDYRTSFDKMSQLAESVAFPKDQSLIRLAHLFSSMTHRARTDFLKNWVEFGKITR
jgi:hypothetical protein